MSIFNFNHIECPRCLGKGHVDQDDIERLKMQLKWSTGPCAYCNSKGTIPKRFLKKVAVDELYLTDDISSLERERLLARDAGAVKRSESCKKDVENFLEQVRFLHGKGGMDAQTITDFYRIAKTEDMPEEDELRTYIQKIIDAEKE